MPALISAAPLAIGVPVIAVQVCEWLSLAESVVPVGPQVPKIETVFPAVVVRVIPTEAAEVVLACPAWTKAMAYPEACTKPNVTNGPPATWMLPRTFVNTTGPFSSENDQL